MKTLLLLENQSTYSKFLKFQCQGAGYRLKIARGPEAIQEAFAADDEFGLILVDDDLIKSEGTEILSRMRAAGRSEPVVLVSDLDNLKMLIQLSRYGLVAVLEKPIAFEDLEKVLARVAKGEASLPDKKRGQTAKKEKKTAAPEDLVKPFLPFQFFSSGSLFALRWMSTLVRKAGEDRKIVIGDGGEFENVAREYARIRYGRKYAPKFYPLETSVDEEIMSGEISETIFPVFTVTDGGSDAIERLATLLDPKRASGGDFIIYLDAPDGIMPDGLKRNVKEVIFSQGLVLPPLGARPADGLFYLHQTSRNLTGESGKTLASFWTPERLWSFWLATRHEGYRNLIRRMRRFWDENQAALVAGNEVTWPGQDLLAESPWPELQWPESLLGEARSYVLRILEMYDGDVGQLGHSMGIPALDIMAVLQGRQPSWWNDVITAPSNP